MSRTTRTLFALAAAALGLGATRSASAQIAYSLADDGITLISFNVATPGTVNVIGSIKGATTSLSGLDFRPSDGLLYGYDNFSQRIYTVNTATAATTLVSTLTNATTTVDVGIDFNPNVNNGGVLADRLRIVTDTDQNLRVNVDTGVTIVDTNLAYVAGDPKQGVNPNIIDVAYTTNDATLATPTTLYGIDYLQNTLVRIDNPNGGTLTTVGALGVDTGIFSGFDIFTALDGTNTAYAELTLRGLPSLYTINLTTGAATLVGSIGAADMYGLAIQTLPAASITVVPEPGAAVLLAVTAFGGSGLLAFRRARRTERR